jgi:uncharacterized repeat protein (TIGR01451 family)
VAGGSAGITATGFRLEAVDALYINANVLGQIHGGDAPPQFYYLFCGREGGSATGIELATVTTATITNNAIWSLTGGRGSDIPPCCFFDPETDGGDATALLVSGSSASIGNNSCYQTVAGAGGEPDGEQGSAVGLRLAGDEEVTVANNALIGHGTGISSALSKAPLLAHNDLWANGMNYEGVAPGDSDLHVPPAFIDAKLHIGPDSPLIDAGTNVGIPNEDLDGDPRPLDGNDDGIAIADVGADEYWPGLRGSAKTVDKLAATAGDVLTYQLTLATPRSWYDLPGVQVTDPIPNHATYVPGSLCASGGSSAYAGGVITWTGAVSVGVPVTVTFRVTVDQVVGPQAIVNRAVVDARPGSTCTLQATTLVDPLRYYLPAVLTRY